MVETTSQLDLSYWREADRQWAERFVYALTVHTSLPATKVGAVAEEARQLCTDAGESPQALFGDPDDAAQKFAAEHTSAQEKADARATGPAVAFATACWVTAWLVFLLTWFITDYSTWHITKPLNLVAVSLFSFVLTASGTFAWSAVSQGRIKRATVTALVGLLALGASGWVLSLALEGGRAQTSIPFWWALTLALFLFGAGLLTIWTSSSREKTSAGAEDIRDWFDQLEGYLRGQHFLTKTEARSVVQEARAHLEMVNENGVLHTPEEEFSSASAYAEEYVREVGRFGKRQEKAKSLARLVQGIGTLCLAVYLAFSWDWNLWGWVFFIVGVIIFLTTLVSEFRTLKRLVKQ